MPLVQIHLREGKSAEYIKRLSDSVYLALSAALISPEDPKVGNFQTIHQYKKDCMIADKNYLGVQRSDEAIFITVGTTKISAERKRKVFEELINELKKSINLPKEDLFVHITEWDRENWYVGL